MPKKIKVTKPIDRVRSDFADFLERAVPVYQKKLLTTPWPIVQRRCEEARVALAARGEAFLSVDRGSPIEPQLALIAKLIADMSFAKMGVHVFGKHWLARHPGAAIEVIVESLEEAALREAASQLASLPAAPAHPGGGLRAPTPSDPHRKLKRLRAMVRARRWRNRAQEAARPSPLGGLRLAAMVTLIALVGAVALGLFLSRP